MKQSSKVLLIAILSFLSFKTRTAKGQTLARPKSFSIKPFEATIVSSDYSAAYSVVTVLTQNELKIVFKSELAGENDTVLFSKSLQPSKTLAEISNVNLDSLKDYYSNNCIRDGSQVTVIIKRNGKEKGIHLSNYYQEDVGKIIYLTNSLVPDEFKVWYDKEELIASYKRCHGD